MDQPHVNTAILTSDWDTVDHHRFRKFSFAFGLLTGIGCNLSSFGVCFIVHTIMDPGVPTLLTTSERFESSHIQWAAMLLGSAIICGMAALTLSLANELLLMAFRLARQGRCNQHSSTDDDDSVLKMMIKRFESRFLMGSLASGGIAVFLVLLLHLSGRIPGSENRSIAWLLYSTEVLLVISLCGVWYGERYQAVAETNDDDDEDKECSLQTPLLTAASMV